MRCLGLATRFDGEEFAVVAVSAAPKNFSLFENLKKVSMSIMELTLNKLLEIIGNDEVRNHVPGSIKVQANSNKVASVKAGNSVCEAYSNGYAVYDNGDRKTVVRISDCTKYTYKFNRLRKNEKAYENVELDLKDSPWYLGVILACEERIQANMEHSCCSSVVTDENVLSENFIDCARSRFGNPEAKFIRKEAINEARKCLRLLPDSHAEVFKLYHEYDYKQNEIAKIVGVTPKTVRKRLNKATSEVRRIREWLDENFV